MTATPRFLDWDTQFFGARIASLSAPKGGFDADALHGAEQWCAGERIDCLYLRSDADDVTTQRAAGELGFRFVDVRITLDCDLGKLPTSSAHEGIRVARPTDIAALRTIAAYNHTNTRFYADGRFARERCDELYATWIEKSVNGWAERVLVPDEGSGALGYLTIHLRPGNTAEIGLVGLASDAQGRGLGRKLVESAIAWMRSRQCARATVVTQGRNIAAQRLYQSAGLRTQSMELWHHRWFT